MVEFGQMVYNAKATQPCRLFYIVDGVISFHLVAHHTTNCNTEPLHLKWDKVHGDAHSDGELIEGKDLIDLLKLIPQSIVDSLVKDTLLTNDEGYTRDLLQNILKAQNGKI